MYSYSCFLSVFCSCLKLRFLIWQLLHLYLSFLLFVLSLLRLLLSLLLFRRQFLLLLLGRALTRRHTHPTSQRGKPSFGDSFKPVFESNALPMGIPSTLRILTNRRLTSEDESVMAAP